VIDNNEEKGPKKGREEISGVSRKKRPNWARYENEKFKDKFLVARTLGGPPLRFSTGISSSRERGEEGKRAEVATLLNGIGD